MTVGKPTGRFSDGLLLIDRIAGSAGWLPDGHPVGVLAVPSEIELDKCISGVRQRLTEIVYFRKPTALEKLWRGQREVNCRKEEWNETAGKEEGNRRRHFPIEKRKWGNMGLAGY
ncbi:unnamed protein product [Linum trigynum]|uniref:Uncharacterized protein n=1 Tax=Linum trigynum TaxID=586398 RepID=A0AAV2EHF2_9ROSI